MDIQCVRQELWIRSPGNLSKGESVVVVSALEKWNEIPFWLMELHICYTIGSTQVLITTLPMCVPFVWSILTTSLIQSQKKAVRDMIGRDLPPGRVPKKVTCVACQTSKGMETVAMPYVFRYLAAELAAMNIKMTLQLSSGPGA
ncbi:UNVERIFIED_CONTAM: DNA-directed RNA polymerase I subunit [Sesamum radiatum]|uniref:DNA-directed RNA polymerase I subunit n=1 Tax=Sesamum radiatum TaxID=300843 RepID=A0AAW2V948_SESRA